MSKPRHKGPFAYQLGTITDGNNEPVTDRAFIEIVEKCNPQVLLGEISVEIADANSHARLIAAAPKMLETLLVIISASDKCQGHRNCDHNMTGWLMARAVIAEIEAPTDSDAAHLEIDDDCETSDLIVRDTSDELGKILGDALSKAKD